MLTDHIKRQKLRGMTIHVVIALSLSHVLEERDEHTYFASVFFLSKGRLPSVAFALCLGFL